MATVVGLLVFAPVSSALVIGAVLAALVSLLRVKPPTWSSAARKGLVLAVELVVVASLWASDPTIGLITGLAVLVPAAGTAWTLGEDLRQRQGVT